MMIWGILLTCVGLVVSGFVYVRASSVPVGGDWLAFVLIVGLAMVATGVPLAVMGALR
jgi:hypothetical protein